MMMLRKNKRAGIIIVDIIMYFIILVLLIGTFIYLVVFTPSNFKDIEVVQSKLTNAQELQSAFDFQIENKTFREWIIEGELNTGENPVLTSGYNALFTKFGYCVSVTQTDTVSRGAAYGDADCEKIIRTFEFRTGEAFAPHVRELGKYKYVIIFDDIIKTATLLGVEHLYSDLQNGVDQES